MCQTSERRLFIVNRTATPRWLRCGWLGWGCLPWLARAFAVALAAEQVELVNADNPLGFFLAGCAVGPFLLVHGAGDANQATLPFQAATIAAAAFSAALPTSTISATTITA